MDFFDDVEKNEPEKSNATQNESSTSNTPSNHDHLDAMAEIQKWIL